MQKNQLLREFFSFEQLILQGSNSNMHSMEDYIEWSLMQQETNNIVAMFDEMNYRIIGDNHWHNRLHFAALENGI